MTEQYLPEPLRTAVLAEPGSICLAAELDHQAGLILKMEAAEISNLRGRHSVTFIPEAGLFPTGSVICWTVHINDDPARPFHAEAYLEPRASADLQLLRLWEQQASLELHLVDMTARYVFSKSITLSDQARQAAQALIERALTHNQSVAHYDYRQARQEMIRRNPFEQSLPDLRQESVQPRGHRLTDLAQKPIADHLPIAVCQIESMGRLKRLVLGRRGITPYLTIWLSVGPAWPSGIAPDPFTACLTALRDGRLPFFPRSEFERLLQKSVLETARPTGQNMALRPELSERVPSGWHSLNAILVNTTQAQQALQESLFVSFAYPRQMSTAQALIALEDALGEEREQIPDQVLTDLLPGAQWPNWLAAALLFGEIALRLQIALEVQMVALAQLIDNAYGRLDERFPYTTKPNVAILPSTKIEEWAHHFIEHVTARVTGSPNENYLDEMRTTDYMRVFLCAATLFWDDEAVCQSWNKKMWSQTLSLALVGLAQRQQVRIAGVKLPLQPPNRFGRSTYLWPQVMELQRDHISADALRSLLLDGQPVCPTRFEDEVTAAADLVERFRQIEAVLERDAVSHAAFAPSGGVRLNIPRQLSLLQAYGTCQLVCYIERDPGDQVRGLWVRVYDRLSDSEGKFLSNFVVRWVPDRPLNTSLIPDDYAVRLHLVIAALWRDLRVAGERALPREGSSAEIKAEGLLRPLRQPRRSKKKRVAASPLAIPRISFSGRRAWSTEEEREHVQRRAHHVDGHRRLLPEGWLPRDTAEPEALLDNIILRPGETYVNPHERGLVSDDPEAADAPQPKTVVARGLAVLITNFRRESR